MSVISLLALALVILLLYVGYPLKVSNVTLDSVCPGRMQRAPCHFR